ncbi:MAG: PQQ-binding-like beta-propeller repeat protein [Polyangia bacterium]
MTHLLHSDSSSALSAGRGRSAASSPAPFWSALGLLFIGLSGCAEAPFSVHTQDNDLKTLKPALDRLKQGDKEQAAPRNGSGHALAFVFAGPEKRAGKAASSAPDTSVERTLIGYDLSSGKELFAVPADVRSRFVVTQGVLAAREGDELVLRDTQTGAVRARAPFEPGETLAGLTTDSSQIYLVTRKQTGRENKSFVTALGPSGQRLWRLPAQGSVGAPAAGAGVVALPYRYQDVVLLDARSGSELTRIRQKDEQINFVRAGKSGFYYGVGADGVAWLDERSTKGERGAIAYLSPQLGERVRVFLNWDGYRAEQVDFSAFDRNRLLWDAELKGDKLHFRDDQAVLHSYRFLFAMDTVSGAVRWAYAQPRQNLMASDINDRAVLFAAQDGELGALDRATGAKLLSQRLTLKPGQQVLGGVFDAAGFAPSTEGAQPPRPVLEVLRDIVFDRDSSFLSVKTFAVQALGKVPGPQAQSELVRIITADGMPAQIARSAGDVLIARKDAPEELAALLTTALKQSYDYLEDKRPKGLDVLAKVAAARSVKEAAPLLAERLLDPGTPAPALKEIALALGQLGGKDAAHALRELLLVYRADPLFSQDPDALKRAGEGLLKLDGEAGRRTLQFVTLEPRSLPGLSSHFRKLLDDTAWKPKPAVAPKQPARAKVPAAG